MIENKNIESSQKVEPEEFTGIIDKKILVKNMN